MMNFKRADRVADLIKAEISDILLKRVKDPRIENVTITGVKLSDDLRSAKIFFVQMGQDTCSEETMTGMQKATGFLKRELGMKLQLRHVPDITFIYDKSFDYGTRIDRLLEELKEKRTDV